jgi:hypothetical protein
MDEREESVMAIAFSRTHAESNAYWRIAAINKYWKANQRTLRRAP